MTEVRLKELWQALAGADAKRAHEARWLLSAAAKQTLPLLRQELRPVPLPEAKEVATWIAQLDSPSFQERNQATQQLAKAGDSVAAALAKVLDQKPSLE